MFAYTLPIELQRFSTQLTMSNKYIIYGPNDHSDVPKESMGKFLFDCLRKNPEKIINIDALTKESLTCGELLEKSIKLAIAFKRMSLQKDDVITIISNNSINYFVPVLAAFYIGVVVNPLNPNYTAEELKHALHITRSKVIFCSEAHVKISLAMREDLKFIQQIISLDCEPSSVKTMNSLLKSVIIETQFFEPEELAYLEQGALILLSSGTTGLPKGVLLTHQNLRQSVGYMSHPKCGTFTPRDVMVQFLPLFHVFGLVIHIAALTQGMKVILMPSFEPRVFLECIQEYRANKLHVVPVILNFIARSPLIEEYDLSSVQDLIVGAAPVDKKVLEEVSQRLPNSIMRQGYGLTEATGGCIFQAPDNTKVGTVGTLAPLMEAKVWDCKLNKAVGPLELGELCLKGPNVMKYYISKEKETCECIDSEGFLHSGDIGFYDEKYNIYIVDRVKDMIKYKGFQVSPVELENLIMSHPKVQDCGVVGIPNEKAGEVPCAFVVRRQGVVVPEAEIINFVAERISVHKRLHGGVIFVEEIPKTTSGKILRRTLLKYFNELC